MELIRWTPRRDVSLLPEDIDRSFERFFRGWMTPATFGELGWSPNVDISESDGEIVVKAEMPGMTKDDIEISVEDNQLILSGEKKQEKEEKGTNYYRMERSWGAFRRLFTLPARVDTTKVKASYTDGVLTVRVPKSEAGKARKIQIGT